MAASSSDDDELSDVDSEAESISSHLSSRRKQSSLDRRSGHHYDRSNRLRRRLTALEDEPATHSTSRKSSTLDDTFGLGRKHSGTSSRDSISSYGGSSRFLNGSHES